MNPSIPAPAAHILKFIYRTETGHDAPECYEVVFGHKQAKLPKPLTSMTFDEVVAGGPARTKSFGSSAAGAAQFMRDTLDKPKVAGDIKAQMKLTGNELFDADLQDLMAFHLLKRRGYEKFMAGTIGVVAFGKALAQEWASFPVLESTKGAHRQVARGETFYAGDKLNKALISPDQVEALLREAKAITDAPVSEPIEPVKVDKETLARVQAQLYALGYTEVGSKRPDGTFDGEMGTMTRSAILAFRNENGLPDGSFIDQDMLAALWTAKPRKIPSARTDATPAVVREQVPEAKAANQSKLGAWVLGVPAAIGTVVTGVLDNLDGARGYLEPVKQFASDIPTWAIFAAVAGAAFFIWQRSQKAEQASSDAFKTGERR